MVKNGQKWSKMVKIEQNRGGSFKPPDRWVDDGCPGIDQLAPAPASTVPVFLRKIDAKSTGGGVPCLAGSRLHRGSCRSFSHVCDTLAAAPRHLTLCAVPCLVSSVQFSACLVTTLLLLFCSFFCSVNKSKQRTSSLQF